MNKRTRLIVGILAACLALGVIAGLIVNNQKKFDPVACKAAIVSTIETTLEKSTSQADFDKRINDMKDSDGKLHLDACDGSGASDEQKKQIASDAMTQVMPTIMKKAVEWTVGNK